jgi:hypothetical protein
MRTTGVLVIALAILWSGDARAESVDFRDVLRRTEALVQSIFAPTGREVISPPGDVDPRMAFEPPLPPGTMRVIPPPERPEQQR